MISNEKIVFWKNLEKIQDLLLLGDAEFSQHLGIDFNQFRSYKSHQSFLPMDSMFQLAEEMNFQFDNLLDEDFQFKKSIYDYSSLHERYTTASYSLTRPILNIIDYVETTRGLKAKSSLLKKFQLSEDFVKVADNRANVLLISDINRHLVINERFTASEMIDIGRRFPFVSATNALKEKLSAHTNALSIFECFVYELCRLFDTNCTYQISEFRNNQIIIEAIPKKHVVDELRIKTSEFSNEETCLTKMGVLSSTMYFRYGRNATVKKISSVGQGAKSNKYLLDLSPFSKMDKMIGAESTAGIFYQPAVAFYH